MEIKDNAALYKQLEKIDLNQPEVLIISGTDASVFDIILGKLKTRLLKSIGEFETTIFSGEPGDTARFQEDLFNIPMFSPYRLFVIRQASEVFKPVLADKQSTTIFSDDMSRLPDRTFLALQYDGPPPKKLLNIFGKRYINFLTRDLFSNQIPDVIRDAAKKLGLALDDEAMYEIRERVEPKTGSIEQALRKLKDFLPESKHKSVNGEITREILFPNPGYNPFELVDSLFIGDFRSFEREFIKFNPAVDNLFVVLKLILNRVDEIRRAAAARSQNMSESEMLDLLGLKNRPPFIQKKIIRRLQNEVRSFNSGRLVKIYDFLIDIQKDFRSNTPGNKQPLLFQERVLEVFFT